MTRPSNHWLAKASRVAYGRSAASAADRVPERRRRQVHRHLVVLQRHDGARDAHGARLARRTRGVTARGLRGNGKRGIALLGDADQGGRLLGERQPGEHREAFVQHHHRLHAARLQERESRLCAASGHFFVMAEEQHDGPLWHPPRLRKRLGRLEDGDDRTLVVHCAAAPDVTVRDDAAEWAVCPVRLRARVDRHDILVGHQDERRQRGVRTGPGEKQGQIGHPLDARGEHQRVTLLEHRLQFEPGLIGTGLRIPSRLGHRADADRLPQARRSRSDIHRRWLRQCNLRRRIGLGAEHGCAPGEDSRQPREQQDQHCRASQELLLRHGILRRGRVVAFAAASPR